MDVELGTSEQGMRDDEVGDCWRSGTSGSRE